ncbi:MAG: outer membrane beta-barrel protein [Planctomycetes bacterium]|nr:outer membrane beta-barrel protein [Planctomycetota bacterium]
MLRIRHLIPSVLLAAGCAHACAEEGNGWDLRLALGGAPGVAKAKTDNSGASSDIDDHGGGTIRFSAYYTPDIAGQIGLQFGPNIAVSRHNGHTAGGDFDVSDSSVGFAIGPFLRVARWRFGLTPYIDLGSAREHDDAGHSDSGPYVALGLTVGAMYTFDNHLILGADLGVEGWSSKVHQPGIDADVTYSGSGGVFDIYVGFKL